MRQPRFQIALLLTLLLFWPFQNGFAGDLPVNLIPMYGGPEIVKLDEQKKADEDFIKTVTKNSGSRQKASIEFAQEGWNQYKKGSLEDAMLRFNQSWLLNPDNHLPYWGFGSILLKLFKPEEAIIHYERSLSLIDSTTEKPSLLNDTAIAYWISSILHRSKTVELQAKAESLFQQAVLLDPKYSKAYISWIDFYIDNKKYSKAWEIVKIARKADIKDLPQARINALAEKMPEP